MEHLPFPLKRRKQQQQQKKNKKEKKLHSYALPHNLP